MLHRNTYLVVEPMRPIAEDLALALKDHDPESQVLLAGSADEALARLRKVMAVTLAIVHAAPSTHKASALGIALSERGAVSVLIGDRAEEEATHGFFVLQRPYATETILDRLARLWMSPGVSPGD